MKHEQLKVHTFAIVDGYWQAGGQSEQANERAAGRCDFLVCMDGYQVTFELVNNLEARFFCGGYIGSSHWSGGSDVLKMFISTGKPKPRMTKTSLLSNTVQLVNANRYILRTIQTDVF